ncbi:16983_t:CDS:2, partial [Funneliformis geosporum]
MEQILDIYESANPFIGTLTLNKPDKLHSARIDKLKSIVGKVADTVGSVADSMHQLEEEVTCLQSKINDPKLMNEIRQLHSEKNELMLQITRKNISLADAESKFSIKLEEMQTFQFKMKEKIQALQSRAEELEQNLSLAQKELSEMESLR